MTPEELAEGRELAGLSPDDVIEKWRGIAVYVAQRMRHRIRDRTAYDDLLQVCCMALLRASTEWDEYDGVPWRPYAATVISRDAEDFVMVERRHGLTRVGDVAARQKKKDFVGPKLHNLSDRDVWVKAKSLPEIGDQEEIDRLKALLLQSNVSKRIIDLVDMIALHDMRRADIAKELGLSRQRVTQLMARIKSKLIEIIARNNK